MECLHNELSNATNTARSMDGSSIFKPPAILRKYIFHAKMKAASFFQHGQ